MAILFIASNRLGDAVLSTSILAGLMEEYPGEPVIVACGPVAAPLFASCPVVQAVWPLHKKPHHRHWGELWKRAARQRWRAVYDVRGSALAYTVRARERKVFRSLGTPLPKTEQFRRWLRWPAMPLPTLWITPAHRAAADALLPADTPLLVLGPTANWPGKQWPGERFAETAQRLTAPGARLSGATVVVLAAPNESGQLMPLLERLPGALNLTGQADLPVMAAVLERAALYIGNDSGLMHLAAASGCPTLGLFGPSDERVYGPIGMRTAWVRTPLSLAELTRAPDYNHRTTGTLMEGLTVIAVVEAAEALYTQ